MLGVKCRKNGQLEIQIQCTGQRLMCLWQEDYVLRAIFRCEFCIANATICLKKMHMGNRSIKN